MVTCAVHRESHALAQILHLLHHVRFVVSTAVARDHQVNHANVRMVLQYARKLHPEEAKAVGTADLRPEQKDVTAERQEEAEKPSSGPERQKLFSVFDSGGAACPCVLLRDFRRDDFAP